MKRPKTIAAPKGPKAPKSPKAAREPLAPLRATPRHAVMLAEPDGAAAEAVRALRTRIQSQHINAGRRALAICGASPEVGCSFVAVNLAISLSQVGIKTLLIDGNLREPTVQNYFQVEDASGGLQACLASPEAMVMDFIHEHLLPDLDVMFAGPASPRAQELIANERFPTLVNACMRDYDITIIDTPPANRCSDALRISMIAGFSLIVARKNRSLVSDVRTLADQLRKERAVVVGTVLNSY